MSPVFLDTNVPMYAAGTDHSLRGPCQRVVRAAAEGTLDAVTDVEVFQEILYRYWAIGQRQAGLAVFDSFHRIMLGKILPVEQADIEQARALLAQHAALSPRDAIHLAVMVTRGIREIISADLDFDAVPGVQRIDPTTFG
ncbi:MAG: type II toxin-antitoxin system VapC family toxin [Armatimonadetes bacterium]|nr:type II toxin-antitoxin system VapC family toxin [Armatimonadota bacterium]